MNWYKQAQNYQYIKDHPEEFEYPEDELYFSIGQNKDDGDNSYCWIWNGKEFRKAQGGTHSMNFPDLFSNFEPDDPNVYRGWADPFQEMISVVAPRIEGQVYLKIPTDLPTRLRVALGDYWPNYDIKVF